MEQTKQTEAIHPLGEGRRAEGVWPCFVSFWLN